jgi:hypothetical protein
MVHSNGNDAGNGYVQPQTSAATKLRKMIQTGDFIVAPGVYEGFSARIAHEVGFDCIYMASTPYPYWRRTKTKLTAISRPEQAQWLPSSASRISVSRL